MKARDVAAYILQKLGPMPAMKLQKLVYYAQAWHLVWTGRSLFPDRIEAWANGPVTPDVWDANKYQFTVDSVAGGSPSVVSGTSRSAVDSVLKFYGSKTAGYLSALTHGEQPWLEARKRAGVLDGERANEEITKESMRNYYSRLKSG